MFEKASRMKLRFQTNRGALTTEDLWALSLEDLNALAKSLNKACKEIAEEDFLKVAKPENAEFKLRFDIVLHILNTKKAEKELRELAADKKARKEKLMEILARQEDASLEKLSPEELRKKIEELG